MTNKELLEDIIIDCEYYGKDKATIDIETIRSVLKDLERLEAIDNANHSEALKAFERLNEDDSDYALKRALKDIEIVKQALLKAQEQDKILELLKKCYYASSIDETLYKTSYGFDNPQDVRKIGGVVRK